MDLIAFRGWTLAVDPHATAEAHQGRIGSPEACGCADCRLFASLRERIYPHEFVTLLERLGVPVDRESEVYAMGPLGHADGATLYEGWYHVAGEILSGLENPPAQPDVSTMLAGHLPLTSSFAVWLNEGGPLVPPGLSDLSVVQIEFRALVPTDLPGSRPLETTPRRSP